MYVECLDPHLCPYLVKDLAAHSVPNTGIGGHWGKPQIAMITSPGPTVGVLLFFPVPTEEGGQCHHKERNTLHNEVLCVCVCVCERVACLCAHMHLHLCAKPVVSFSHLCTLVCLGALHVRTYTLYTMHIHE